MTDTDAAPPIDPFAPDALNAVEGLDPVDPAYRHVLRIAAALNAVPLAIGASVADALLIRSIGGPFGLLTALAWLVAILVIVMLPSRRMQRWGYHIGAGQLRVARGWMFRTDTIVPFKRIQHIDLGEGPIERMFGLASLTVHTAGTHNSIVTLPGLARGSAEAMRDAMRLHIRREAE